MLCMNFKIKPRTQVQGHVALLTEGKMIISGLIQIFFFKKSQNAFGWSKSESSCDNIEFY